MKSKRVGEIGEKIALRYFKKKRYRLVKRNFSSRFGEIDLIVKKKKQLVFVEVKTRLGKGRGEWSINSNKIAQVQRMAEAYLIKNKLDFKNLRIDAVCIDLNHDLQADDLRHYKNLTLNL